MKLASPLDDNRYLARAWRCSVRLQLPVFLAVMAGACAGGSDGGGSSGSGGSAGGNQAGRGGTTGEAGTTGAAGNNSSGSAGAIGAAGSSGSAGVTGAAGTTGSGGQAGGSTGTAGQGGGSAGRGGRSGDTGQAGRGGQSGNAGQAGGAATGGGGQAGGSAGAVRSAGCGKTSTITFATVPGEPPNGFGAGGYVTINGRSFAMRLPDNYENNKPYWLIFGFHWNGGTSKDVDTGGSNGYSMAHFGLQSLSRNGAIFVAPQGNGNGWGNSGGADLRFLDDMVKLIEDNYCVDTTRLYANGFSYGGGMSYAIACARAKVFRGVAIYNGAQLSGCEGGTDPIAYWQMAGLTDTVCTVAAGAQMRDKFVRNNACTTQNPPQPPQPPPYSASAGHICTTYSGCSSGHPLRWCVHQSGHGNAIVDGTSDLYNTCATPPRTCSTTCPCTWVPADVWSFFTSL
jgi:hypothetical protein